MKNISILAFVVTLFQTPYIDLVAQEAPLVFPGARVRVLAPTIAPDRIVGTVVSLDADTLVLKANGLIAPLPIPLVSVIKLDVSRGEKSKAGRGAVIGSIIGGAAGTGLGLTFYNHPGDEGKPDFTTTVLGSIVVVGGVGAGLGALIGAPFKTERWEKVPLEK